MRTAVSMSCSVPPSLAASHSSRSFCSCCHCRSPSLRDISSYTPLMYCVRLSSAACCATVRTLLSALRAASGYPRIIRSGRCGAITASRLSTESCCASCAAPAPGGLGLGVNALTNPSTLASTASTASICSFASAAASPSPPLVRQMSCFTWASSASSTLGTSCGPSVLGMPLMTTVRTDSSCGRSGSGRSAAAQSRRAGRKVSIAKEDGEPRSSPPSPPKV
mmetsp:Transcript_23743/g.48251  ORF Transcript_23743/g.48251 Transcript_23743/m.48251 type:complete len:222 (+) Transcript_23743:704-1369(+)